MNKEVWQKPYVIGVDPGMSGAIVIVEVSTGQIIKEFHSMKSPDTGRFDVREFMPWIYPIADKIALACIEDVHAIFGVGATSTFEFGKIAGELVNTLDILSVMYDFQVLEVLPASWQTPMWANVEKVMKPTKRKKTDGTFVMKVDPKQTSLKSALLHFPGETFIPEGKKKPQDGIYDAALIALYASTRVKQMLSTL